MDAAQIHSRRSRVMHPGGTITAIRRRMRQIADDGHLIAIRLERLENFRHFKAGARSLRLPLADDRAMRDVDRSEAALGLAAVWRKAVWAGTIDSRKGSATATPAPRRKVRRKDVS